MTALHLRPASFVLTGLVLLTALAHKASAQQPAPAAAQPHPIAVGGGYDYLRTNLLPGCNCFSINSGYGQVLVGVRPHVDFVLDVSGGHRGGITPDGYALTLLTYTAGFRYSPLKPYHRLQPFGELLFGGSHDWGTLAPNGNGIGGHSNEVALLTGGGLTLNLAHGFALQPVEVDYNYTNFRNGQTNHQNNLRLSTGVVYRFRPHGK
jgi:peptidoglycan-associated lipoprotein